jgi:DNA-binding NarL/FixJ family response regulator
MKCIVTVERKGNGLGKELSTEYIDDGKYVDCSELIPMLAKGFFEYMKEHENIINNEPVKIKSECNVGRKKSANVELIQKLRSEGKTQEQVARELNISISTVRRNEK